MTDKTKDPNLFKSQTAIKQRDMIKDVERYKKFATSSVTALMVIAMVFLWIILFYHWFKLQYGAGPFKIGRTRETFITTIDFEQQ